MVHYCQFKKEIGSLDVLVKFEWPSRFFLQNQESRISVASARVYFVSDPKFSRSHRIGLIWARVLMNMRLDSRDFWAHLLEKVCPKFI